MRQGDGKKTTPIDCQGTPHADTLILQLTKPAGELSVAVAEVWKARKACKVVVLLGSEAVRVVDASHAS